MIKPSLVTITVMGFLALPLSMAGDPNAQDSALKEVMQHQADLLRARDAMAEGDKAFSGKHYDVAVAKYRLACGLLQETPVNHEMRARAIEGFSQASVDLAKQLAHAKRYEEARSALKAVLDPKYNPNCKPAIQMLSSLEEPEYFTTASMKPLVRIFLVNKLFIEAKGFYDAGHYDLACKRYDQILALDPTNMAARKGWEDTLAAKRKYEVSHEGNQSSEVAGFRSEGMAPSVKKLLAQAKGFYDTGRFDLAYKRYDQVLDLDPQNAAARKGQEDVLAAKEKYANDAYSVAPRGINWQVESLPPGIVKIATTGDTKNTEYIAKKLNHIIIPKIDFKDTTVRDAIDFLRKKSIELDTIETDQARKGVNIVLKLAPVPVAPPAVSLAEKKVTFSLTNIPLSEALRYVTELAGMKVKVEPDEVLIVPLSEPADNPVTK